MLFRSGDNLNQSDAVQAVVDKFGAADLSTLESDFEPELQRSTYAPGAPVARFMNGSDSKEGVLDNAATIKASSPLTYIGAKTPPFLVMNGSKDNIISPSQSLKLTKALKGAGVDTQWYVLDGAKHGDMAFVGDHEAGKPWSTRQVLDLMTVFFHQHLDPKAVAMTDAPKS